MAGEVPLSGGGRTAVARSGDVVHRETGPWARSVHALLRHFESVGFAGAPQIVGTGFDAQGRETLTFIEGSSPHPYAWSDEAMPRLGALLRAAHDAARSFVPPPDAIWRDWFGRTLGDGERIVGHCDTGQWNVIARDGQPVALIDWEQAGPVDPLVDLAQTCWLNAHLFDDDIAERLGLPSAADRAQKLRLLLDGYGLPRERRLAIVPLMIELATHAADAEASEAGVTPDTIDPTPLWAIAWRARSAAWMLRHRRLLENAMV